MKKTLTRGISLALTLSMVLGFNVGAVGSGPAPAGGVGTASPSARGAERATAQAPGADFVPELDGPVISREPGGDITWDFESGKLEPFQITVGAFGDLVTDIPYAHNSKTPYPRQGNYHLSTLETLELVPDKNLTGYPDDAKGNMTNPSDNYVGAVRSPIFRLDESKVNFLVGGGNNPAVYVALCDVYGRELSKANNSVPGETMVRVEWDLPEMVGQYVFVKVVDSTNGGWGHITFDDFHAKGYVDPAMDEVLPEPAADLKWSFEDGVTTPFSKAEGGTLGDTIVVPWACEGKDGEYFFSTREVDGAAGNVDLGLTGSYRSAAFHIEASKVRLKLAGSAGGGCYAAVCDAGTGAVLAKAEPAGGDVLDTMILDLGAEYAPRREVYLALVDNDPAGYLAADAIHAKGEPVMGELSYKDYQWSFEDQSIAPLKAEGGITISYGNADTDVNGTGAPMNKDGTWFVHTAGPGHYTGEGATGAVTSPLYCLDPENPSVKIRLGGDASGACYAAICDESGKELVKVNNTQNQNGWGGCHMLTDLTLTVPNYAAGTPVYLKLVDNKKSGFGFIQFDDVRFRGTEYVPQGGYSPLRWSFERGDMFPFTTRDDFGKAVADLTLDPNGSGAPLDKHGTYFLCTGYKTDEGAPGANRYDESYMGSIRSPLFILNPEEPVIRIKMAGGSSPSNYIAACDADGNELGRVSAPASGHVFKEVEFDLTGKADGGQPIYLKIVDGTTSNWGFLSVDDIRASVLFKEEAPITSASQVTEITGWDAKRFTGLAASVQRMMESFDDEYVGGQEYLTRIAGGQAQFDDFWQKGTTKPSDPKLTDFQEEMDALEREALVANPLLNVQMAFVTRYQYAADHHNTHNMFPDCEGEINQGAYRGKGAVKVMDLRSGAVSTLLSDPDGVYRDLDASYEGDKLLVSYRRQKENDSYHIWEYDLNGDKTAVDGTGRQLTSMQGADDMDPLYLPDGRIIFGSTRDPKYVMCNRHISANIYRMEGDGANIVKITNSTLFERPTDVLPDGRILYDRWEYNDRDFGSAQGLWSVYSDGTQQVTYYGNNSPTGATIDGKSIPGTDQVMVTLSSTHDRAWGGLAILDRSKGVDGKAPVVRTWPANAQTWINDPLNITATSQIGSGGHNNNIDAYSGLAIKYEDPQPLSDEYFLASRQIKAGSEKMGIYLLDIYGNETLLYEDDSDLGAYDATVLQPRVKEISTQDRRDYKNGVGTFFVQNVYEGTHMQGVEPGSVKTLRIVESMAKRYIAQAQQWGGEGQQNPGVNWHSFETKRVIGEVPVYEDGSAYFEVPEDKFVYFQLLDEDGRMIQSMRSGTLVQSGEKTGCIGCHEDRRSAPSVESGRTTPMALEQSVTLVDNPAHATDPDAPATLVVNVPDKPQKREIDFETGTDSLADWDDAALYPEYTDLPSMNYLTEVQPIFTKNCMSCHGYENPAGGLTLVPDKDVIFNASYRDLWRNRGEAGAPFGALAGAIGGGSSAFTRAKTWGSYGSPLIKKIFEDPEHAARLTDAEKRRIAEWVDLNAPYYGDYSSNYAYNPGGRSPLNNSDVNTLGLPGGYFGWGSQSRAMVYFDNPEKSPILQGLDPASAAYQTKLAIIKKGLEQLRTAPDIDWRGLSVVPGAPDKALYNQWEMCALDAWRTDKSNERWRIETAFRDAIINGEKLYDSDIMNPANGFDPWPAGFPGWPTEANPGHNPSKSGG